MQSPPLPLGADGPGLLDPLVEPRPLEFGAVYEELFPFVWRLARRLGVNEAGIDDVCQETFVVVHRRLAEFEGRSSVKTWVFSILHHVVQQHRRTQARKSPLHRADADVDPESLRDGMPSPLDAASGAQAARIAHALLAQLDDDKRTVFALVELEGMTVPEVAEATQQNLNTVYGRLRAARTEFSAAVARFHATERRSMR